MKTIHLLEDALVEHFYTSHETEISSITVPNPLDSNEIYSVILREKFLGPDVSLLVVESESMKMPLVSEEPYAKLLWRDFFFTGRLQ